jgi:hypothetical protein
LPKLGNFGSARPESPACFSETLLATRYAPLVTQAGDRGLASYTGLRQER